MWALIEIHVCCMQILAYLQTLQFLTTPAVDFHHRKALPDTDSAAIAALMAD